MKPICIELPHTFDVHHRESYQRISNPPPIYAGSKSWDNLKPEKETK